MLVVSTLLVSLTLVTANPYQRLILGRLSVPCLKTPYLQCPIQAVQILHLQILYLRLKRTATALSGFSQNLAATRRFNPLWVVFMPTAAGSAARIAYGKCRPSGALTGTAGIAGSARRRAGLKAADSRFGCDSRMIGAKFATKSSEHPSRRGM